MDMLRKAIISLRTQMKEVIRSELYAVDREHVIGIAVLSFLVIISPMMIYLVRNAVTVLQLFSSSVKQKAAALRREQGRAEQLIYQMLPPSMADNIRQNKPTSELFDSATVAFTGIVDFRTIARSCSPLQLCDLLNTLYRTFDSRIDDYDVYKVETINDSYMVASGLPERNGDRHAAEVANLCIDLVNITPGILVSHDPSLRLIIRIGMHTGVAMAGVVGSKMPRYCDSLYCTVLYCIVLYRTVLYRRYCLFGDTVNVASRMQSTGEPMKIQITYETKGG